MTSRDDLAKRREAEAERIAISLARQKVREGPLSRAVKELLLGLQRTCALDVTNAQ